jgi:hypothetical protein
MRDVLAAPHRAGRPGAAVNTGEIRFECEVNTSSALAWRVRAGSRAPVLHPGPSSRALEESCSPRPEPRGLAEALCLVQSSPTGRHRSSRRTWPPPWKLDFGVVLQNDVPGHSEPRREGGRDRDGTGSPLSCRLRAPLEGGGQRIGSVPRRTTEADVARASRQPSAATPMSGERLVIGASLQGVASSAWNESDCEMPRASFLPLISVYVTLR